MRYDYDLILVGGGLAAGLVAYRLITTHPQLRMLVVERDCHLGGNHTWSFHETDLSPEAMQWVRPLVSASWDRHEVKFPRYQRQLSGRYHSIRSEKFHRVIGPRLGDALILGYSVKRIAPHGIVLNNGRKFSAKAVLDARGSFPFLPNKVGYQKFVGLDLRLEKPHGLKGPVLMDAAIPQQDGFRFFYVLPFDERTLLIEDTHYSDGPSLNENRYREEILAYAAAHGWKVEKELRIESGALPIPLEEKFTEPQEIAAEMKKIGVPYLGMRANHFHPTTGYSFPDAVRLADAFPALEEISSEALVQYLVSYYGKAQKRRWFYYFLNRMLFSGAAPEERYRILQRFYRMPERLIARFYAGQLTFVDYARILVGKPPIPLHSAWRCFRRGEASFG